MRESAGMPGSWRYPGTLSPPHRPRPVLRPHDPPVELGGVGGEGPDRAQQLELLVAVGLGVEPRRGLHRDEREQLEHVVLEHVAQAPRLLVVARAVLDADRLGHGDLHVVDVLAVPERLEERVGEAEHQDVLDGLLAEVVVDAVDLPLGEQRAQAAAQRPRRGEVAAEGLLDDDPRPLPPVLRFLREAGRGEGTDDRLLQRRRHREVEEPAAAGRARRVERGHPLRQRAVEVGLAVVPRQVEAAGAKRVELLRRGGDPRLERGAHRGAESLVRRRALPVAQAPEEVEVLRQQAALEEAEERRDEFAVGEVARGPEDDDAAGVGHRLDAELVAERDVHLHRVHAAGPLSRNLDYLPVPWVRCSGVLHPLAR